MEMAKTQYKNGMDDHDKFIDSLIKQGAKFRRTMKHGFPVTARKTVSDVDFPQMDYSVEISDGSPMARGGSTNRSATNRSKTMKIETTKSKRSKSNTKSNKNDKLNIDSELEMTGNDDFDSDDTEFLHKTIPGIGNLQKPACFCNSSGAYCENH